MTGPHECGMCDGPLEPLGVLGRVQWWRCRSCGWEHSERDCCEAPAFEVVGVDE